MHYYGDKEYMKAKSLEDQKIVFQQELTQLEMSLKRQQNYNELVSVGLIAITESAIKLLTSKIKDIESRQEVLETDKRLREDAESMRLCGNTTNAPLLEKAAELLEKK